MKVAPPSLAAVDWQSLHDGLRDGYSAPRAERASIDAVCGRGAAAYGEIEPASLQRLLAWLAPTADDVLFDLGSGTGRLILQALCTTGVGRVIGVELCTYRHGIALAARRRLLERIAPELAETVASRIELRREDARTTNVGDATLVYLGATCFTDDLLGSIARHVALAAPELRVIATARPLPRGTPRALVEIGRIDLAMSWADRVGVHLYARRGRCNHAAAPLQNPA